MGTMKQQIFNELLVRRAAAVAKERVYVDDVSEVPEGKEPKRGERDGIYYEEDSDGLDETIEEENLEEALKDVVGDTLATNLIEENGVFGALSEVASNNESMAERVVSEASDASDDSHEYDADPPQLESGPSDPGQVADEIGATFQGTGLDENEKTAYASAIERGSEAFELDIAVFDTDIPSTVEQDNETDGLAVAGGDGDFVYVSPDSLEKPDEATHLETGDAVISANLLGDENAVGAYTVLHEMAHAAHFEELRESGNDLEDIPEEWEAQSEREIAEGFTSTAAINPRELVADVGALLALGADPPDDVKELYDEYNGPEVAQ